MAGESMLSPVPQEKQGDPASFEVGPAPTGKSNIEKEASPEVLIEQSIERAEKDGAKTMEMLAEIGDIERSLNPGEVAFVQNYMARNPASASLSERIVGFFHAHEELQEKLSRNSNPKLVQLAHRAGKVVGGVAGFLGGYATGGGPLLGSVMGAIGSKLGANAALRLYERFGINSTAEKSEENPELPETLEARMIAEKGERNTAEMEKIKGMVQEIGALSPEQKRKAIIELSADPEVAGTIEQIEADQERIASLYEHIEKSYPLAFMALEAAVHFGADSILHNYHLLAETGLLIVGIIGAAGVAEKSVEYLVKAGHKIVMASQNGIQRFRQFLKESVSKGNPQVAA
jgi:hypothetical protein